MAILITILGSLNIINKRRPVNIIGVCRPDCARQNGSNLSDNSSPFIHYVYFKENINEISKLIIVNSSHFKLNRRYIIQTSLQYL